MMDVGRVCVKIAGREAGKVAVLVGAPEGNFVLVDGQVKRRKCNIHHLEPLAQVLHVKKGASHADVVKELKSLKVDVLEKKAKAKKVKPVKVRKKKVAVEKKQENKGKEKKVKEKAKP